MKFYLNPIVFFAIAIQIILSLRSATGGSDFLPVPNNSTDEPPVIVSYLGDEGIIKILVPEKFKTVNLSSLKGFIENLHAALPKAESIKSYTRHNPHFHYPFVCYKFSHSKYTAEG